MSKGSKLYFGSQQAAYTHVQKCIKDGNALLVVSIVDPYSDKPDMGLDNDNHIRLPSKYDMGLSGYTFEDVKLLEIYAIVKARLSQGHDVVIHCTEGRMRSPVIAMGFYEALILNSEDDVTWGFPKSLDGIIPHTDRDLKRRVTRQLQ